MAEEKERVWFAGEEGAPMLRCVHCAACGKDLFPPQMYGCPSCGAHGDRLQEASLPAEGTLISFAAVQQHAAHPVPFTLGDIALDAGPIVRVELAEGLQPRIGDRLRGMVVGGGDGERLEFAAVSEVTT